ncbi:MAG: BTAD domain-containing putative transcriptional regulator [Chloroflexota bacterium]
MNTPLQIALLGRVEIRYQDQPLPPLDRRKAEALLFYLVCSPTPQSREVLADMFWPEDTSSQARRNLSYTLYRLRQALEDYILSTRQTLGFNHEVDYWLDVSAFEESIKNAAPPLDKAGLEKLATGLALYQGDFLAGFYLSDAPAFDNWISVERERLFQRAIDGHHQLIEGYLTQSEFGLGIEAAKNLLALDPLDEEAHEQMIRMLALNGQRAAAIAQYETFYQLIDEELGVEPSPEISDLYIQIRDGDFNRDGKGGATQTASTPSTSSDSPFEPPFQAPPVPKHFVGRAMILSQLSTQLLAGDSEIHALVGMGGLGKTTLAAQLAHQLQDDFTDGVLWANVATSAPQDILNVWGRAYDYDFSNLPDLESRATAMRGVLAKKNALIVIDNLVQSSEARPLLPGSESCAVLLTTRDLDLAHALNAEAISLDELDTAEAHQMLTHILGEDRVTAEEEATAEICGLLQNLPLAVEIVAQRLKSRPRQKLGQMAKRLREMKHRLGLEVSDQAVRASFEVSWEALSEELQHFFPHLAVFEGRPFQNEAVAYLADLDPFDAEDYLYTLVALSLVKEEGETQYRQHPLLADFAREKLGDDETVYGRMSDYYLDFSQENKENYEALEPEWENIMATMEANFLHKQWNAVIKYSDYLSEAWFRQGRYTNARQAFQWAHEAASKLDSVGQLASNLRRLGQTCIEQGNYDKAKQYLKAALEHYKQLKDKAGLAQAQYDSARMLADQNHYDEAETMLVESLSYRIELNDMRGVADVLYRRARILYDRDASYDQAEQLMQEALPIYENAKDVLGILRSLRFLSVLKGKQTKYDQAQMYIERGLELAQQNNNQEELALLLFQQLMVARFQGELQRAIEFGENCLPLFQRMGDKRMEALVYYELSLIDEILKAFDRGLTRAQHSLTIQKQLQNRFECATLLMHIGDLYNHLGRSEDKTAIWREAQKIANTLSHPRLLASLSRRLE